MEERTRRDTSDARDLPKGGGGRLLVVLGEKPARMSTRPSQESCLNALYKNALAETNYETDDDSSTS